MTSVGENAALIRSMFPQLDLDDWLQANPHENLECACNYLLSNPQQFKTRNTVQPPVQSELENSNDTADALTTRTPIDFEDPIFLNRLERLVDYFIEEKTNVENNEVLANLIEYLCSLFPYVRKPIIDMIAKPTKKYSQQAILVILFFVNNNLSTLAAFNRLREHCKGETWSRDSQKLHWAPRCRMRNLFMNDKLIANNLARFENKLLELATGAYNSFALLLWKQGKVQDLIPAEQLELLKFECEVCCERHLIHQGFSCEGSFVDPNEPCSSKRIKRSTPNPEEVHTFCVDCIRGQVEATITGAAPHRSGLGIQCLSTDCDRPIFFKNISKYILQKTRAALEKRLLNQNLCGAGLEDLEHCLKCDFAMVLEASKTENKVFKCQSCAFEYCRICEFDWSVHFGKSCEEVKKDNTRQEMENKLSEAIIRYCPKCKLQFVKESACNKMRCCICGTTMCYICRTPNIDYNHFCNHFRDPACSTTICSLCKVKKCLLWEDYVQYDRAKVESIISQNK